MTRIAKQCVRRVSISDGPLRPVRYFDSAPITLIARINVAYGSDATLKKCDINCVIIPQLIISSKRQRDQAVRTPPEMGSEPENSQFGNRSLPRNKAVSPQAHTYFLTLIRHEAIDPTLGVSLIPISTQSFLFKSVASYAGQQHRKR